MPARNGPTLLGRLRLRSKVLKLLRAADRLRDQREFLAAADLYGQAVALAPGNVGAKVQMANMLKDAGRHAEAEQAYLGAIHDAPSRADTYLQLGHVRKLVGRRYEAMASYRHAAKLNPSLAAAHRELADAGESVEQLVAYEQQMRQGGVDSLMVIRSRLDEMAGQLDEIRRHLPDAQAKVAFPIETYSEMRALYDVPPPRPATAGPSLAVVLFADREPVERLYEQLAGIQNQSYANWVLRVIGADADRREIIGRIRSAEPRITWTAITAESGPAAAEIEAGRDAGADWVLYLSAGAVLHPQALAWFAATAARTGCAAIVCDEEVQFGQGREPVLGPILRQAVDPDSLLQANLYGETVAVAASVLKGLSLPAGHATISQARSQLLLTLVGERSVAHIPLPLVRTLAGPDQDAAPALAAHYEAVRGHLADFPRLKVKPIEGARVALEIVRAPAAADTPIAVIIATKNNSQLAADCINSLIAQAGRPDRLEILLINNGMDIADDPILSALGLLAGVTIWADDEPFNWSKFNNDGAGRTVAPYLVFANDDMVMLSRDWDQTIRALLERNDVGSVGGRLLYPDGAVQHGGVLFDWNGGVIHDGLFQSGDAPGPTLRWKVTRSASAVTGAFMATRRADFEAVGGFDDIQMPISYSDVDYALKLRARGLRVIWSPDITLHHYESKTRGLDHLDPLKAARHTAEQRVIERRWPGALQIEPGVNPAWVSATLPFRLLSPASSDVVWDHIVRSAAINPWEIPGPVA